VSEITKPIPSDFDLSSDIKNNKDLLLNTGDLVRSDLVVEVLLCDDGLVVLDSDCLGNSAGTLKSQSPLGVVNNYSVEC
jgi:hypothetical protein